MLSIRVSPKPLSTRVIYQGQSEAALSTGGSPKPRYLPGGSVRSRVIYGDCLRSGANLGPSAPLRPPCGPIRGCGGPMGGCGGPMGPHGGLWGLCGAHSSSCDAFLRGFLL